MKTVWPDSRDHTLTTHSPLSNAPPSVPGSDQGGKAGHPGFHLEWSGNKFRDVCLILQLLWADWLFGRGRQVLPDVAHVSREVAQQHRWPCWDGILHHSQDPPVAPRSSLTTPDTPSLVPTPYSQMCLDLHDLGRN